MDAIRWTESAKVQIADLLREGQSASTIASQFPATTRNAIIGVVHRDKQLKSIGFARSPRCSNPMTKKATMPHKPENRFAALIKPRLAKPRPGRPKGSAKPRILPAGPVAPRHIALVDIRECQCRWPLWETNAGPFIYCGAATALDASYCKGHAAKVFQAGRGGDGQA